MGAFAIYNDHAADSTVISNLFIDEYMKDANDAQMKVYLYLVRMMSAGLSTSITDIADRFNHTEKEVVRSLHFWERKGLLSFQTDSAGNLTGICLREPRPVPAAKDHQVISITPLISSTAGGAALSSSAVTAEQMDEFQKKTDSRQLIMIVEQYIGKPLSSNEARTVYFISEQLHFSEELIDYLVEYCVGLGKKDFRYIEKVALNWAEDGISTAAQARKAVLSGSRSSKKGGKSRARSFQSFEKTSYDFDELEKHLLSN